MEGVTVIGFHEKSPFDGITHYVYGDEDWRVSVTPLGSGSARYGNRHASAFFGHSAKRGEIRAEDYTEHPGDISLFARLHLRIDLAGFEGHRFILNSAEVHAIISD